MDGDYRRRSFRLAHAWYGARAESAGTAEQAQALRLECGFGARADVEFAVDLLHVVGDRVARQAELHADLGQREALGHAQQHLALALGELHVRQRVGLRLGLSGEVGDDLARDARRQRRLTLADALQLLGDQLTRLLLEDVAVGAGLQRGKQVLVVVVDRHDDRLRLGLRITQLRYDVFTV